MPPMKTSPLLVKKHLLQNEDDDKEITQDYNRFVNLYSTQSIIDYSKIEISNSQPLDKSHKNIVSFFCQTKLEDLHYKIIDDLLEENIEFETHKVNILSSTSVKNRKYFIFLLPANKDLIAQHLFYALYTCSNVFDLTQTYCVENNLNLPVLELFSYIFTDKDIKLRICQGIILTPDQDQIPIILDQYHTGKNNLHRGINETVRRIKEGYTWPGLTRDVEVFIKKFDICQKVKIYRKNLSTPLVITETPKTPFERINIDLFEYPIRNYALTIRDELTKFTQAYPLLDKKASSVVNTILIFFQHYGTPLRIHSDQGREFYQ
ncbi:uncharacterized protein LOC126750624 [Anthonomus grandis grandis]|uniref:uncharacterized protein LOC126750624 n=1 Tax=Anthonomus grandis grandis TaxID=2921223 RepID=UPI0021662F38|nr:uncharacterized protein LOC126750624 [Anthonomus grandis grandis]